MNRKRLGRRGVLTAGLATILTVAPGVRDAIAMGETALAQNKHDTEEADDSHARFRAAFLDWLHLASGRLALPVSADVTSPTSTEVRIRGVHPAIGISLEGGSDFSAWVEWEQVSWDSWLWLDVYEEPVSGGWVNTITLEEYQVVHPTLESLWAADVFEPLLAWINDYLAPATHIAMWGSADDATWARLVRDRKILGTKFFIEDDSRRPTHLLPIHSHLA